jgi:hypothetical protein
LPVQVLASRSEFASRFRRSTPCELKSICLPRSSVWRFSPTLVVRRHKLL